MRVDKKLKFTILITQRALAAKVIDYLKRKGLEDYFSFYGKGSASIAILDYLGIGEIEKSILVYPSNEVNSNLIMDSIKNSEYFKNTIAFRVPVKGISNLNILNHLLKEGKGNE